MHAPARGPGPAVALAVWLAIVVSLAEVAVLYLARRSAPMFHVGPDFFWMAPAALIAVVLAAAVPGVVIARAWRKNVGVGLILFLSTSLAFLNLLLLVRGLSPFAAALLAVGGAAQSTRLAQAHFDGAYRLVRQTAWALLAAFLVVSAGIWFTTPRAAPVPGAPQANTGPGVARRPNVLVITLDTVRAASLSLYGYARQTSPNLARFAARGVVFDRAFATAPWTLPSHASLFTGRWAHELSTGYQSPLDRTYPTLAEYLAAHGYDTAGFVANLGYCGYGTGLGRGFGHYEDYQRSIGEIANSSTLVSKVADNFTVRRLIENDQHMNRIDAGDLNRRALSWLAAHQEAPTFVFMNYFDAHEPYLPPAPFDRQFGEGRARGRLAPLHRWLWDPRSTHLPLPMPVQQEEHDAYDGAIAYLDSRVGELLDELDRRGMLQHTLVVITADHGEELGEHGLYDHGYSLYRQALQVPLIVLSPDEVPAARRISSLVSLRDVPATIVEAVGLAGGAPFPGRSLATRWTAAAGATEVDDPILAEVGMALGQPEWFPASKGDMTSALSSGIHCIRVGDGTEEAYDVDADPAELRNLAGSPEYRSRVAACRTAMDRLRSETTTRPAAGR